MNSIPFVLDQPVFQALGWTLVHFLWEGAAVGLLLLIARAAIKKSSARLRYAASCSSLGLLLILPAVTFSVAYNGADAAPKKHAVAPVMLTLDAASPRRSASSAIAVADEASATSTNGPSMSTVLRQWLTGKVESLLPWFIAIWFLGVLLFSLRFAGGLIVARRLKTTGIEPVPEPWQSTLDDLKQRLSVSRVIRLYKSLLVEVPTVVGWLRPVILLPASALTGLGSEQLEALLAHELAHIRRYDYLINIIQTAVETLLFYHPVVWWVSGQVRAERENCCDDVAVSACGDVLTYARALADLEMMRARRPQLAMAADGGSLLNRIERLIGKTGSPKRHQVGPSLAVLFAVAVVMIMLAGAGGVEPVLVRGAVQQARAIGITSRNAAHSETSPTAKKEADAAGPSDSARKSSESDDPQPAGQASSPSEQAAASRDSSTETPATTSHQSDKTDDYIAAMKSAFGLKDLSIDDLVALKIQEVTPAYIRELHDAGYDKLTVRQVIALKIQGISAQYIKTMAGAGYANLPVNDLIAMKIQDVTPEYIRGMSDHGFPNLSASKIIGMKIQGVTPEYIDRMKAAGFDKLRPSELVVMKIQGVDAAYLKEMKDAGLDDLSARSLIGLKTTGVDPEYIKEMRAIGFGGNSTSHLIAMKTQGVTPEYVKEMKDAGLKDLTDRDIIGLKTQGVSPQYIKTMASAGYSNLSSRELISMRIQGVDPAFINEMKASGYSGLKAEELISLRIHGVDSDFIKRMRAHGFKDLTVRQLIQLKNAGIE